jgi:hypothetical protein
MTTYTWRWGSGGSWFNPANWIPNRVPGPADSAILPGTGTVRTGGEAIDVASLTIENCELYVPSSTNNVVGGNVSIDPNGSLVLESSALTVGGDLNAMGELSLTGSAVTVDGSIAGQLSDALGLYQSSLTVHGNVELAIPKGSPNNRTLVCSYSSLTVHGNFSGADGPLFLNNGAIMVWGTLTSAGIAESEGSDIYANVIINEKGEVLGVNQGSTLNAKSYFENDGSVSIYLNVERLSCPITGHGQFVLYNGVTLDFGSTVDKGQMIAMLNSGDKLILGDAEAFAGWLYNFRGADTIDPTNFESGSTKLGYQQENIDTGLLTLTSGAESAHVTLYGSFRKADFSLTADASGHGTLIHFV